MKNLASSSRIIGCDSIRVLNFSQAFYSIGVNCCRQANSLIVKNVYVGETLVLLWGKFWCFVIGRKHCYQRQRHSFVLFLCLWGRRWTYHWNETITWGSLLLRNDKTNNAQHSVKNRNRVLDCLLTSGNPPTYVDEFMIVSLLQVMKYRSIVKIGQIGHIFGFLIFRWIDLRD